MATPCFEPLPLMRSIYRELPYITNIGVASRDESNATVTNVFAPDHLYRSVFWGCFIVIATVFLLLLTLCYCCCTCCVCCLGDHLDKKKPTAVKVGCCLVNTVFIVLGLAIVGAAFWAEVTVNMNIQSSFQELNNTGPGGEFLSFLVTAEPIRHWVIIAYLVLVVVLLLLMLLSAIFSPVCKNPAAILILLGFFVVLTLLTSVMAGAVFFYLIILGDFCIGLYNELTCFNSGAPFLDTFCNDTYLYGFIFLILSCGLVVTLILIQLFAVPYATTLTGKDDLEKEQKQAMNFQEAGGVWDAYGAQQVLGVTSQSQPVPETVPMSPVGTEPPQYADVVNQSHGGDIKQY